MPPHEVTVENISLNESWDGDVEEIRSPARKLNSTEERKTKGGGAEIVRVIKCPIYCNSSLLPWGYFQSVSAAPPPISV